MNRQERHEGTSVRVVRRFLKRFAKPDPPELVRHVALLPNGAGANFMLYPGENGAHRWAWRYDAQLVGLEMDVNYTTHQAMYQMDRALGLPLDEMSLRPTIRPDGEVISEHSLVGYGDPKVPPDLPGWPWNVVKPES
jgi:hypothetical protein